MRLPALSAIAGFSAFAVAFLGTRMLAPFYGLTTFLVVTVIAVTLASLAVGLVVGAARVDRDTMQTFATVGTPFLAAACWTIAAPWLRTPLLLALQPLGLRLGTALAVIVLIAPTLVLLGTILPRVMRFSAPTLGGVAHVTTGVFAPMLIGAALSSMLTIGVLLPALGVRRTMLAIALLQLTGAGVAFASGGASKGVAASAAAVLVSGVLFASHLSATPRDPKWGLVDVREGAGAELRVLDKNDGRYLLADGTIHTIVSQDYVSLQRAGAALEVLKLLAPRPDTILVLGLRGGTVAKSFARDGWAVRAVDPEARAVKLAAERFSLQAKDARVTVSDIRVFTSTDRSVYPLIVLDAFGDSAIPYHLVTAEFFDQLARRMRPGGILALTIETEGWDDVLLRSLAATLGRRFQTVWALPTGEPPNALGSIVVLAATRPLELRDDELPDPSAYHSDPEGHWSVMQMNHAWNNRFHPDARGARILTDDGGMIDLWSERLNHAARRELHAFFGPKGLSW